MAQANRFVQQLESRTMFAISDNPRAHVDNVSVVGTEKSITAVVLHFSDRLDPITAQDVRAYRIGHYVTVDDTATFMDYVLGTSPGSHTEFLKAKIQSAVYDDSQRIVTLTPTKPFAFKSRIRTIKVFGAPGRGVKDASLDYIDGNQDGKPRGDQVINFTYRKGKSFTYTDTDGDKFNVTLAGKGSIASVVSNIPGSPNPIMIMSGTNPDQSTLVGKLIKKAGKGNGQAVISQIIGLADVKDEMTGRKDAEGNSIFSYFPIT